MRDEVEITVGGQVHKGWQSYDIDSDLMVPADAWRVSLAQAELQVPAEVQPGAAVQVRLGGQTVLQGKLDVLEHAVGKQQHTLHLQGRDDAGQLLDCSAPIFSAQFMTLEQVVAKIVRPLGIVRVRIDTAGGRAITRDRVSTEPGDTAWECLRRAAEANGLWPWFEPDGTLVVGGPDYAQAPVEQLVLRRDGLHNNVLQLSERRAMTERYSQVTVLGQAHAVGNRDGRPNVKGVVKDDGVTMYRPKVVIDHEAVSQQIAVARGSKLISDSRVKSYQLQATVKGHRTAAGLLWSPGQRVQVLSEPHGIDGVYFLMQRRFTGDKQRGQVTTLTLHEDGVWALYAHPSHRRHRRGKNSLPGRVVDLSTGAAP